MTLQEIEESGEVFEDDLLMINRARADQVEVPYSKVNITRNVSISKFLHSFIHFQYFCYLCFESCLNCSCVFPSNVGGGYAACTDRVHC